MPRKMQFHGRTNLSKIDIEIVINIRDRSISEAKIKGNPDETEVEAKVSDLNLAIKFKSNRGLNIKRGSLFWFGNRVMSLLVFSMALRLLTTLPVASLVLCSATG